MSFSGKCLDGYKEWGIPEEADYPVKTVMVPMQTKELLVQSSKSKTVRHHTYTHKLTIAPGNVAMLPSFETARKRQWRAKDDNRAKENEKQRSRYRSPGACESPESRRDRLRKRHQWYGRKVKALHVITKYDESGRGNNLERFGCDKGSRDASVDDCLLDTAAFDSTFVRNSSQNMLCASNSGSYGDDTGSISSPVVLETQCPPNQEKYLYEIIIDRQTGDIFHHLLVPIPEIPKTGYKEIPVIRQNVLQSRPSHECSKPLAERQTRTTSFADCSSSAIRKGTLHPPQPSMPRRTKIAEEDIDVVTAVQRCHEGGKKICEAEQLMMDIFGPPSSDEEFSPLMSQRST